MARLNQTELARITGVSREIISHWEAGVLEISPEYVRQLCELFRCSKEYLLKEAP